LLVDGLGVGDPGGSGEIVGVTDTDTEGVGEGDGDVDVEADDVPDVVGVGVGVGVTDGSTGPPTALPSRQVKTYSTPGGVGRTAVGDGDFVGGALDEGAAGADVDSDGLADVVCAAALGVIVGVFDGMTATEATGRGAGVVMDAELADAAEADCAATCCLTRPWEVTRSWLPLTSRPTRSTAVNVTAVMSTQESNQPSARVSGRPGRHRPPSADPPASEAATRRHHGRDGAWPC
jgi:fermentation-respiration switch protein FrsA (DUF1100 family)